ncbi:MAG TPA: type IV toxin-antitoxin system AbiEi family antitoxin domain-containing protein [Baekduia sp.]|nr:type IV toxin-antitoxin system AbiEi family antitoxin domain-containing protein [Baekduia sp.]
MDSRVRELADRQHGVVGRGQLVALGLPATAVDHRLRAGTLRSVHRGVYALGHRALRREGWWMAAVLACGPGAVLSHQTATAAWGLTSPRATIHVTVPVPGGRSRRGGVRLHRVPALCASEITRVGVLPVTTVGRTLLDVAASVDRHRLEQLIHHADQRARFDRREVEAVLGRCAGRPGAPLLSEVLARLEGSGAAATRSGLEVALLRLCDAHGLPRPVVNSRIGPYEVDCRWPGTTLVVEADGPHHRMPAQRRRDHDKRLALEADGWRVITLTEEQIEEQADATAQALHRLLAQHQRRPTR